MKLYETRSTSVIVPSATPPSHLVASSLRPPAAALAVAESVLLCLLACERGPQLVQLRRCQVNVGAAARGTRCLAAALTLRPRSGAHLEASAKRVARYEVRLSGEMDQTAKAPPPRPASVFPIGVITVTSDYN